MVRDQFPSGALIGTSGLRSCSVNPNTIQKYFQKHSSLTLTETEHSNTFQIPNNKHLSIDDSKEQRYGDDYRINESKQP